MSETSPSSPGTRPIRKKVGPSPPPPPPRPSFEDDISPFDDTVYYNLRRGGYSTQHQQILVSSSSNNPSSAERHHGRRHSGHNHPHSAIRRVQRVTSHAALTTKQVVWDSNDASIGAALSAVDQWESAYNALRGLLVASVHSAQGLYGAAKEGVGKIEHGFLIPVRDWILLPAFGGVERAAIETVGFLQSSQAKQLACNSLELAKKVPVVGENLLAPAMCLTVGFVQRSWEIAQYPIPSKNQVRDSVDVSLNFTKWALASAFREVCLYVKRADANITRSLSHTQWKVLGSGPYATLDKLIKRDVIDHLCERYFSLLEPIARYELAAHIRCHNRPLYHDLVFTGCLKERGGALTEDDEWLSSCPIYRLMETPFLMKDTSAETSDYARADLPKVQISPLWFRLPHVNGKRPGKDAPWVCFRQREQYRLEEEFHHVIHLVQTDDTPNRADSYLASGSDSSTAGITLEGVSAPYPTVAQWYNPNLSTDVLVDQKRHAVSFFLCCPRCRKAHDQPSPPLVKKNYGDLCDSCSRDDIERHLMAASLSPPTICMIMRPTFWRFHGPGDDVRRATWLLETRRNGIQPFDEAAQAILEDAYLFLNWMAVRQAFQENMDGALLTVEVPWQGDSLLVQFGSVRSATAIQKGLGAAVALFKRRVYRGAWLEREDGESAKSESSPVANIEQSIRQAGEENGFLGETAVPDASIRAVLMPTSIQSENRLVLYTGGDQVSSSLAAPPLRLLSDDMIRCLENAKDGKIDHLVLIVHGIGEMLRSIDVFGLALPNLSSIIECCGSLRRNHEEVQDAHFSQMYPSADATSRAATGRVEYLPIEWHEAFSILSQRRLQSTDQPATARYNVTLHDISLRTIPQMRDFANDTLMDVLYFMSPAHHDVIVSIVSTEMNVVVNKFRQLTGFNGRISVIGHSLGSIIAWDILDNQILAVPRDTRPLPGVASSESLDSISGYMSPLQEGSSTPELTSSSRNTELFCTPQPQLDFSVDNFFLLGSPVAVFLMIRNQRKPLDDEFVLRGCKRVFNIFHPYDPVAYRIEPCIDPRNADFEPTITKHWNGGFRVQYQTKRLWRKLVDTTWRTQLSVVEAFEASMAGMGLLDSEEGTISEDDNSSSEVSSDENRPNQVITGQLNQGRRIDYMLQEKEIESANEYVAALAAHSSYWIEKDLSLFVARQIYLSTLEFAAENASPLEAIDDGSLPSHQNDLS